MEDGRRGSWEKKNEGLGDEVMWRWRLVGQVGEEEALVVVEQQGLMGLWGLLVEQMMGEKVERVGGEMQEVDLTEAGGQEGWEVELQEPKLDSEGVGDQVVLEEEECHRVQPHLLLLHLLQGAGSVHGHWHEHGHEHGHGHVCESEQAQEPQDQVWTLGGKCAHHS